MAKASIDLMNVVHLKLATYYEMLLDSEEDLSSGQLAAINTFLKNNDINVDIASATEGGGIGLTLRKIVKEHEEEVS